MRFFMGNSMLKLSALQDQICFTRIYPISIMRKFSLLLLMSIGVLQSSVLLIKDNLKYGIGSLLTWWDPRHLSSQYNLSY